MANGDEFAYNEFPTDIGGWEGYNYGYDPYAYNEYPTTPTGWEGYNYPELPIEGFDWTGLTPEELNIPGTMEDPGFLDWLSKGAGGLWNIVKGILQEYGGSGEIANAIGGMLRNYYNQQKSEVGRRGWQVGETQFQPWLIEEVGKLREQRGGLEELLSQVPSPGLSPEAQARWLQEMEAIREGGGYTPEQLRTRQALEAAQAGLFPREQYEAAKGAYQQFLNLQPEQTAADLAKRYGAGMHRGPVLSQMISEDQTAKLAALQGLAGLETQWGGMFQRGAEQAGAWAPQIGGTYSSAPSMQTAQLPKATLTQDIANLMGLRQQPIDITKGLISSGLTPTTRTQRYESGSTDEVPDWLALLGGLGGRT